MDLEAQLDFLKSVVAKMSHVPRVLIVDDDPADVAILQHALQSFECVVDYCNTAEKAEKMAKETAFDVIVVDAILPTESGIVLVQKLKERNTNASFVVVTGHPGAETKSNALKAGAIMVLEKPVSNELLASIFKKKPA